MILLLWNKYVTIYLFRHSCLVFAYFFVICMLFTLCNCFFGLAFCTMVWGRQLFASFLCSVGCLYKDTPHVCMTTFLLVCKDHGMQDKFPLFVVPWNSELPLYLGSTSKQLWNLVVESWRRSFQHDSKLPIILQWSHPYRWSTIKPSSLFQAPL